MKVDEARRWAAASLAGVSETPQLDADVLLVTVLGANRAGLMARGKDVLPARELVRFQQLVERRRDGEPVAYITGLKSFRFVVLAVDGRVLVPRPETEMLVDVALSALNSMPGGRTVVDVGTGSGAVALALAMELRLVGRVDVTVRASDISQDAIDVAAENRQRLDLEEAVELVRADLLDCLDGPFDVILANLPYLRTDQRHPSTAREPESALYAGADGFDAYRRLFEQAPGAMTKRGIIAIEIDPDQAALALDLARRRLPGEAAVLDDLAGCGRVLIAGAVDIVRTVTETFVHGARSTTS